MEFAVVTTLNEIDSIGPLVLALREQGLVVVVVDDGSSDGTPEAAREAGAVVLEQVGRMGIGPCLVRGWQYALGHGADRLVQLDAGGSHDPGQALRLLSRVDLGADVVIGTRFCPGAEYVGGPWWRPVASAAAAMACRWVQSGAWYSDWTSGYRAFSRTALEDLVGRRYFAKMHGWQIEVLALAGELGLRVAEVPISYQAGRSSFNARVANEAINVWLQILHHRGPVVASSEQMIGD